MFRLLLQWPKVLSCMRNSNVHRLLIAPHGLLPLPLAWYFKIEELTWENFYLCDSDICDPHVLVLYGEVIYLQDIVNNS